LKTFFVINLVKIIKRIDIERLDVVEVLLHGRLMRMLRFL